MIMALVGAWFGFANPWLQFPGAILLLPLGLFLAAEESTSCWQAWRKGFVTSLPGYAAGLYWLSLPVHDYGGLPWALALPCPVLVGSLLSAYAGIFTVCMYRVHKHPILTALFAGLLWSSLEVLRNYFLTGFPWLTVSSALAPWPWAIGLAQWIGGYGVSGCVVAASYLLFRTSGLWRAGSLVLIAAMLLPYFTLPAYRSDHAASAALIQGNIDQGQKWEPSLQASTLKTYFRLSRSAVLKHPDIIIWPETAIPFYFQEPSDLSAAIRGTVAEMGIPLLTGSPAYTALHEPGKPDLVLHNRAFLLNSAGQTVGMYDKQHLVPFGEYVPLGEWIPFISKLVPGDYEFSPSNNVQPLQNGPMSMGLLICYEAIFPELAQEQVASGANVLVNISNDAWFGRSSAPLQHLQLTILRAVEQNRAIIRSTNTGFSTFITPRGEIQDRSELFREAVTYRSDIPLLTETSFYHDHFYVIQALFPMATVLCGWLACARRRKSK